MISVLRRKAGAADEGRKRSLQQNLGNVRPRHSCSASPSSANEAVYVARGSSPTVPTAPTHRSLSIPSLPCGQTARSEQDSRAVSLKRSTSRSRNSSGTKIFSSQSRASFQPVERMTYYELCRGVLICSTYPTTHMWCRFCNPSCVIQSTCD